MFYELLDRLNMIWIQLLFVYSLCVMLYFCYFYKANNNTQNESGKDDLNLMQDKIKDKEDLHSGCSYKITLYVDKTDIEPTNDKF